MQADMSKTWLSYYSIRKEPLMVKKNQFIQVVSILNPLINIYLTYLYYIFKHTKKIFFTLKNMDVHCIKRIKNEISFILEIMLCNYTKP